MKRRSFIKRALAWVAALWGAENIAHCEYTARYIKPKDIVRVYAGDKEACMKLATDDNIRKTFAAFRQDHPGKSFCVDYSEWELRGTAYEMEVRITAC